MNTRLIARCTGPQPFEGASGLLHRFGWCGHFVMACRLALIKHQRYAHAHQFKCANRSLRKLKTYVGRVIRDIERRIVGNEDTAREPT